MLTYPNKEVKISLNSYILGYVVQNRSESFRLTLKLQLAFMNGNIDEIVELIKSIFASSIFGT
ncbi:MAG: hypothetical protein RMJ45_03660 [Candidatus Calescibacterium sp.]|nr:hypothetical protein [Candidatus Calescibacterium sp.]